MSIPKSNNSDAVAIRKHLRERILDDVLGMFNSFNEEEEEEEGFSPSSTLEWRVLILDDVTTKVVSSAVGMADLMAERSITSVESILKSREPQPEREAIYFISPTNEKAVKALIKDWDVSETNKDEEEVNNNENEKKKKKKKKLTLFGGGNKKNNNEHNNKKKESKKKPTKHAGRVVRRWRRGFVHSSPTSALHCSLIVDNEAVRSRPSSTPKVSMTPGEAR